MSSLLRTQARAAGRWQRQGVDRRTGEVGPLKRGMTPLFRAQGRESIGRSRGAGKFEPYRRQTLFKRLQPIFQRKASARAA